MAAHFQDVTTQETFPLTAETRGIFVGRKCPQDYEDGPSECDAYPLQGLVIRPGDYLQIYCEVSEAFWTAIAVEV